MAVNNINMAETYKVCRSLSEQIAKEAAASENGHTASPALLDALRASFNEILEFERTYLILALDSFYGAMLLSMETDIDFKINQPIGTDISTEPIRVLFNPLRCAKYSFPEFTGLLVSEILRLVYSHPEFYSSTNSANDSEVHDLLEKASSATVSDMVSNDIRLDDTGRKGLRLPKDAYTVSMLNEEVSISPKNHDTIEYYYTILKNFSKKQNNSNMPSGGGKDGNSTEGGIGNGNNQVSPDGTNGNEAHNWENQGTAEEMKERVKGVVRQAYESLPDDKRGLIPSGILEAIKKILAPPQIPWQEILKQMVGSVPYPYRKTRMRLNRRQPERADLSGRLPKRIVDIVCCFDTSGSMSNDDLKYCFNEVLNILKIYEGANITVIECDAEIQKVYKCKNISEFDPNAAGRGGTSFIPVIELINGEEKYKKKYPEYAGNFQRSLMVYFTDGYGDCDIPQPQTYKNMWVVLNDVKNLSLREPYGEVVSLSTDPKWIKNHRGY